MHEAIINLHMHTRYSDGFGNHAEIATAALQAGLDAVIVTDHNVLVSGVEKYYKEGNRQVLLLVGEEIHDQARQPQKSHLLVVGAQRELASMAFNPQQLVDTVRRAGGLSFIAHPVEVACPAFGEEDISWDDWNVRGLTGIEIWNGFSELKARISSKLQAVYYAFNPQRIAQGPLPEALRRWDSLTMNGQKLVAVGGSDAHALPKSLGPLKRTIFPYSFHFRAINTHLLLPSPLSGVFETDRQLILEALAAGRCFVGYDLPAPTRGFRFSAQGRDGTAQMGEEVSARSGVTLQVRLPLPAECRLIKDGELLKTWTQRETLAHITREPGVYRVEVYIDYLGKRRGWIFSNPIYIT